MLRRLKEQVAPELPDRIEERRDCELTPGQRKLYLAELMRGRATRRAARARRADGVQREQDRDPRRAHAPAADLLPSGARRGRERRSAPGKFDALFEMLEPLLAEGHKVLVFSQFVECLKLLAAEMKRRGDRASHADRRDHASARRWCSAFENDPEPCVFLISLKAGGTGLNLTAASYVVLFDPWWNPAVEAQAIDRTHRIGQTRTVIAYRLLAAGHHRGEDLGAAAAQGRARARRAGRGRLRAHALARGSRLPAGRGHARSVNQRFVPVVSFGGFVNVTISGARCPMSPRP